MIPLGSQNKTIFTFPGPLGPLRHDGRVLGPRRRGAPVGVVRAGAHRGAAAGGARARHARHHAAAHTRAGLLTGGGPAAHTAVRVRRLLPLVDWLFVYWLSV